MTLDERLLEYFLEQHRTVGYNNAATRLEGYIKELAKRIGVEVYLKSKDDISGSKGH